MANALDEARRLKMDCVQVFTKNQQQWKVRALDEGVVREWKRKVEELGWSAQVHRPSQVIAGQPAVGAGGPVAHRPVARSVTRLVSHASYLINLASPDDELWRKSVDLMTVEIERCDALGIPLLVHHPGAYTTSTAAAGIKRIGKAYREILGRTRGCAVVSCLENTVGSGSNLGREFGQIAELRDRLLDAGGEGRVGVCFDTCHAHAGGYDLSERGSAEAALEQFERAVGLSWIRVLHLNDSKGAMGSRLDRHEHIGRGTIGLQGFRVVVNRPEFEWVPKILETPKGASKGGRNLDSINLGRLWRLARTGPIEQPIQGMPRRGKATARV